MRRELLRIRRLAARFMRGLGLGMIRVRKLEASAQ